MTCLIGVCLPREVLLKTLIGALILNTKRSGIYGEIAALSNRSLELIARRRDLGPAQADRTLATSQQELEAIEVRPPHFVGSA